MIKKTFLTILTLVMFVSIAHAQNIGNISAIINMALSGYRESKGTERDSLDSALLQELMAQAAVDSYESTLNSKRSNALYLSGEYVYMVEWLDNAVNRRNVAHSNYIYALSMLEQLSSSSQSNPSSIQYWETQRDNAYSERSSAQSDIDILTPQVEEARIASNNASREYNEYLEDVEPRLNNARAEVNICRMAVRGHVDNIIGYIDDMIDVYKSYNRPQSEYQNLINEKDGYEKDYSDY